MRPRHLLLSALLLNAPVWGMTFQDRLESAEWKVEGDIFACRLLQPVPRFGSGGFLKRAGEATVFELRTTGPWLATGSASLQAAAAPWRPGLGDVNLGTVQLVAGDQPLSSSAQQAVRLLTGLREGRTPLVTGRDGLAQRVEVRLLPMRFDKAYQDFEACTRKLLAVNFEQIRHSQINFPDGGDALDDVARAKLDLIDDYLKADPRVNHVVVSGYSDNRGTRLDNRQESRLRALAVMEYLKAKGFPAEQIELRFFGEQYPLVPNTSKTNRARNRRVTLVFSQGPATPPQSTTAPTATAANPAEPPAPTPAPPAKPKG